MGSVSISNTQSMAKLFSLLIHANGFIRFFGIDEGLFGFSVIMVSFKVEFSLIQENFVHLLGSEL